MRNLWKPNRIYDESKPLDWDNLPYNRLYKDLTQKELLELLQDAKRFRWTGLDLSRCELKSLPEELWELVNLRFLTLGNVTLGEEGNLNIFAALPDGIGKLTNLQHLDLRQIGIRKVPDCIGQLANLKILWLNGTHIREVPASIGRLTNLQRLDLDFTQIREVPDCISRLRNLQTLLLCHCHLKEIPYCLV